MYLWEPAQELGEVPVAVAEEGHTGRDQDDADDSRVDEDSDGHAKTELLQRHERAGGKAAEYRDRMLALERRQIEEGL